MKLYEIANEYQQLLNLANAGEIDSDAVRDTLESLSAEFDDKARNCMMIVRQLEANSAAIKSEIDRLKALQSSVDNSAESLKDYIKQNMESTGRDKLDLGLFKLTLKAPAISVDVIDADSIPGEYWRVIPETSAVDKPLIAKMLKLGKEIPGAKLVAGKRALLVK